MSVWGVIRGARRRILTNNEKQEVTKTRFFLGVEGEKSRGMRRTQREGGTNIK
jgi:hypothetical protein